MLINLSKVDVERMVPDSVQRCQRRTRSNGHKLKHIKFHLNVKKKFFLLRVAGHWNSWQEKLWSSLLHVTLPWQGVWTGCSPEFLSSLKNYVILWFKDGFSILNYHIIFCCAIIEKKISKMKRTPEKKRKTQTHFYVFWSTEKMNQTEPAEKDVTRLTVS